MRLIDADAVYKKLSEIIQEPNYQHDGEDWAVGLCIAQSELQFAPTIEAEPKWIPASEPPEHYRDEYGELIPLLVCEDGTDYPYRAFYDGRNWGDGYVVVPVKWWMPLPQPPKDGGLTHERS